MSDIYSKTYASKSSVHRAAKGAGISTDDYEVVGPDGEGKYFAKAKAAQEGGEVTELPELVPTDDKKDTTKVVVADKPKKRVGQVDGPTKKDAVLAAYKKHDGKMDAVVKELMEKHGMSKAGARTYFYNVKGGRWTEDKKKKAA